MNGSRCSPEGNKYYTNKQEYQTQCSSEEEKMNAIYLFILNIILFSRFFQIYFFFFKFVVTKMVEKDFSEEDNLTIIYYYYLLCRPLMRVEMHLFE